MIPEGVEEYQVVGWFMTKCPCSSAGGSTRLDWIFAIFSYLPDSRVHGANMGPIWGRQDPGGPHVGPMNFAIWAVPQLKNIVLWLGILIRLRFRLTHDCLIFKMVFLMHGIPYSSESFFTDIWNPIAEIRSPYAYMGSDCGDNIIIRSPDINTGISCIGKMASLYQKGTLVTHTHMHTHTHMYTYMYMYMYIYMSVTGLSLA